VLQRADSCRDILTWTFNPKVPGSRPGRPTTNDQFKGPSVLRLIAEAEHTDPDLACFLLLAATTGARRGELCALRWSDLGRETGALTISRSIVETQGSTLIEKIRRRIHPVGLLWIRARSPPWQIRETAVSAERNLVERGLPTLLTSSPWIPTAVGLGCRTK
jgi:integrase